MQTSDHPEEFSLNIGGLWALPIGEVMPEPTGWVRPMSDLDGLDEETIAILRDMAESGYESPTSAVASSDVRVPGSPVIEPEVSTPPSNA